MLKRVHTYLAVIMTLSMVVVPLISTQQAMATDNDTPTLEAASTPDETAVESVPEVQVQEVETEEPEVLVQEPTSEIVDVPKPAIGSVSVIGLDGTAAPHFNVTNGQGMILTTGVLDQVYAESNLLNGEPGTVGTLTVIANEFYQNASFIAIADDTGAFHFQVVLAKVEPTPTPIVDDETDSGVSEPEHGEVDVPDTDEIGETEEAAETGETEESGIDEATESSGTPGSIDTGMPSEQNTTEPVGTAEVVDGFPVAEEDASAPAEPGEDVEQQMATAVATPDQLLLARSSATGAEVTLAITPSNDLDSLVGREVCIEDLDCFTIDDDSNAVLGELLEGTYQGTLVGDGSAYRDQTFEFEVVASDDPLIIALVWERGLGSIQVHNDGEVRLRIGASVRLLDKSSYTWTTQYMGPTGLVEFSDLRYGDYEIRIYAPEWEYEDLELSVSLTVADPDIAFTPAFEERDLSDYNWISFHLRSSDPRDHSNNRLNGNQLMVESISDPGNFEPQFMEITDSGWQSTQIYMGPYPTGEYRVTLIGDAAKGFPEQVETFTLPNSDPRTITWLKPGFSGVLFDVVRPIESRSAPMFIRIQNSKGEEVRELSVPSDLPGQYAVQLAPGSYTYSYYLRYGPSKEGLAFDVPYASYTNVQVQPESHPRFYVTVTSENDGQVQPVWGATVVLRDSLTGSLIESEPIYGDFGTFLVPLGTYDVEVLPDSTYRGATNTSIEHAADGTNVTIQVDERPVSDFGTILVSLDNVPTNVTWVGLTLRTQSSGSEDYYGFSEELEFDVLPGTYEWSVVFYTDDGQDPGYERQEGTISVSANATTILTVETPVPLELVLMEVWVEDAAGTWIYSSGTVFADEQHFYLSSDSQDGWLRGLVPSGTHLLHLSSIADYRTFTTFVDIPSDGLELIVQFPQSPPYISAPYNVYPGQTTEVYLGNFAPFEEVSIYLDSMEGTPIATATADERGYFGVPITFPAAITLGSHDLWAVGASGNIAVDGFPVGSPVTVAVIGIAIDGSEVPLSGVTVEGQITDYWGERRHFSVTTDEMGSGKGISDYAGTWAWRVDPASPYRGASGELEITDDGPVLTVTLDQYTEFGTVAILEIPDDGTGSSGVDFVLTSTDGWRYETYLTTSQPSIDVEVPSGDYTWSASPWTNGLVTQSGSFTIGDGGTFTLSLSDWELHPEVRIVLMDGEGEDAQPVEGVQLALQSDDPWIWMHGDSDENGIVRFNLPDGLYRYSISGGLPKWDLSTEGLLIVSGDHKDFVVVLTELPNATLTVNMNYDQDVPTSRWMSVIDADTGSWVTSALVNGQSTIEFEGLLTGKSYRLEIDGDEWYPRYEHPVIITLNRDTTVNITLTPYQAVELTIIARSTTDRGLPSSSYLRLQPTNGSSSYLYLTPQSDGTLRGTTTVPASQYQLSFYFSDGFYDATFEPVDLRNADAEHMLNLDFTPVDHGFVTFDFGNTGNIPLAGEILVSQHGSSYLWISVHPGQSSFQSGSYLLPGEYDWEFVPNGPFAPRAGSFTITNTDVTMPVEIDVLANGVIILDIEFPETDIEDPRFSSRGGYVIVRDGEGNFVADVSASDLNGSVAISPLAFGTYTVSVDLNGQLWQPVAPIEVTVNAPEVTKSIAIGKYQTTTVTFEVTGSGRPIESGGVNLCNPVGCGGPGGALYLPFDEDGKAIFEHVVVREYRYIVYSDNYETVIVETWTPAPNETVTVNLGTERHRVIFTVTDQFGDPVDGLNYLYASCGEGSLSGFTSLGGGQYHSYIYGEGVTECQNVRIDPSSDGLYQGTTIPTLELETGSVTNVAVQVQRAEIIVSNTTVTVSFDGGEVPEGRIEIQLRDVDYNNQSRWFELDSNGVATIPMILPGNYEVQVFPGESQDWPYVESAAAVSITESNTNHNVSLASKPVLPTAPVTFEIETSDGGSILNATWLYLYRYSTEYGYFQYVTSVEITDDVTLDLPEGTYYASLNRSGLYWGGGTDEFDVVVDGQGMVVPIPVQRIQAIESPNTPASISAETTEAERGDDILITGRRFAANESVDIYWGNTNGTPIGTTTVNGAGSFTVTITVPVNAASGSTSIYAVGQTSEISANTAIKVLVKTVVVIVSTDEAAFGEVILVSASGFRPNETVEMFFGSPDGAIIRRVTASSTGDVSTTVTIPVWANVGNHQVEVVGVQSGQRGTAEIAVVLPVSVVTLNPTEAEAGWLVSVEATGFRPGETVEMFFGSPDGRIIRRVTAASDGSVRTSVRIPADASEGVSAIEIRGLGSGQLVVEPFTVTGPVDAEMTLDDSSGDAGDRITVSGTGFLPNEQVEIFFGSPEGRIVRRLNAAGDGTVVTTITIPGNAISGPYMIESTSASGKTALAPFTVTGIDVNLSASTGDAGTVITVTATGFAPGEQVEMFFGLENPVIIRRVNANSSGTVVTDVTIPARAGAGSSAILVRGTSGKAAQAPFMVTGPAVSLSTMSGDAGSVVTVTATGFAPGEQVEMFFGSPNGVIVRRVNANSSGTVVTNVTIPVRATPGASVIEVRGSGGKSATAPFTVHGVTATVSQSRGAAGTVVTVTATGFAPGEQVEMFFGSPNGVIVRRVNANSSGTVVTNVTIPVRTIPGASVIEVKGSRGKTATVPFTVTGQSAQGLMEIAMLDGGQKQPHHGVRSIEWKQEFRR